jgi:regulator of protease activity HflC (stomatin/prohibitin superfamily)
MNALSEAVSLKEKAHKFYGLSIGVIVLILIVIKCIETVPAGHVKVATLYGKLKNTYSEGFHIVNPLYSFEAYDRKPTRWKSYLCRARTSSLQPSMSRFNTG